MRPFCLLGVRDSGRVPHELSTRIEEQSKAEAAIVEELIDIVLPELKLLAKPIRADWLFKEEGDERQRALLQELCGSLPARQSQAEWLDVAGISLAGSLGNPALYGDFQPHDTGALIGSRLYLLVDGRLVTVQLAGTWRSQDRTIGTSTLVMVGTRVVKAVEVMRDYALVDMSLALRNALHLDLKVLAGRHVPDLPERPARFDAIVSHVSPPLPLERTASEWCKAPRARKQRPRRRREAE